MVCYRKQGVGVENRHDKGEPGGLGGGFLVRGNCQVGRRTTPGTPFKKKATVRRATEGSDDAKKEDPKARPHPYYEWVDSRHRREKSKLGLCKSRKG